MHLLVIQLKFKYLHIFIISNNISFFIHGYKSQDIKFRLLKQWKLILIMILAFSKSKTIHTKALEHFYAKQIYFFYTMSFDGSTNQFLNICFEISNNHDNFQVKISEHHTHYLQVLPLAINLIVITLSLTFTKMTHTSFQTHSSNAKT